MIDWRAESAEKDTTTSVTLTLIARAFSRAGPGLISHGDVPKRRAMPCAKVAFKGQSEGNEELAKKRG